MEHTEVKLLEMMGKSNIRTIKELHEKTGISRTIISGLLSGDKNSMQLKTIGKLCAVLDCEIGDLIVLKK
jgi:putative transcriptional regulator